MTNTIITQKKRCHACKATFTGYAIHCLCVGHDPRRGYWWCSKACRESEHGKERQ